MDDPQEGELAALIGGPEFARMVDRFQGSTGLKLQVFDLDAHPLTPVEDYPKYCRLLQERKVCPLYNDPAFLKHDQETMANCKAGIGHFVAPIRDDKGIQLGAVVGPVVKYASNPVEDLAELAFQMKVFPDDLIQAADAIREAEAEQLLGAGELVSVGLNLLAEMQAKERSARALRHLEAQIAESNSQLVAQHTVDAVIYLTRADYGLALLMDDNRSDLAAAYDQPAPDQLLESKRRLVEGIAEWVKHADRSVTIPDISRSAWSRYLTDEAVKRGSVVGVPIPTEGGSTFGAIVVGFDRPRDDLEEPMSMLTGFVAEGLYALVMGRKLIQAEKAALLDLQSGAYSRRYFDEILEKEISRAARHEHDLAIVLFEVDGYEVLRGKYGEGGLGRILRELVAVLRSRTRKVNTLARLRDGLFCLVIPEADRSVGALQAQRLRPAVEEHPYAATPNGEIVRLTVNAGVSASERGKDDRASMIANATQSLELARNERRASTFRP